MLDRTKMQEGVHALERHGLPITNSNHFLHHVYKVQRFRPVRLDNQAKPCYSIFSHEESIAVVMGSRRSATLVETIERL